MNNIPNIKIDLDTNRDNTEEIILQTDNSCLDEQSFFKASNDNKLIEQKQSDFSKLSNYHILSIHNNNPQIDNNFQNYENFLYSQSPSASSSKFKIKKKVIKDFIERNNYIKEKKQKEEEDQKNKEEMSKKEKEKEKEINKSKNNGNKDKFISFQDFLDAEKQFLVKIHSKKEDKLKEKEFTLLVNMQEKPEIDKNSSNMALKKNRKKVFQRLYTPNKIAFSADKKNSSKNSHHFNKNNTQNYKSINSDSNQVNMNKMKINNNNDSSFNSINNNNKNLKERKYSFKKRSKKDIKSLSSNNFYQMGNNEKTESKTPKNESNKSKNIKFLSKNNSRNNINNNKIKSKINDYIHKTNKSSKKTINKIKKNEREKSFNKYNNNTAKEKMKIFQLNKLNGIIDNLLSKNAKENKINFFLFCELLFNLGFAYALHKNKDNKELNEEYIQEIEVQPYVDESEVTKEFIYKEIAIINEAFNSIINNFQLKLSFSLNTINNVDSKDLFLMKIDTITIEDFKLFIFILSDIFDGYNKENKKANSPKRGKEDKKIKNENCNNSTYSTKTNKSVSILNHNDKINKIISKILPNKKLEDFNNKAINNYKEHFKYLSEINNKHIIYYDNEKKRIKKEQVVNTILNKCTFTPKTNSNNDLILDAIKPNMNFEERNQLMLLKNNKRKSKIKKELENELSQEATFEPVLNGEKDLNYFKKVNKMIEKERLIKLEKDMENEKNNIKKRNDTNTNNINVIKPKKNSDKINKISKTLFSNDKLLNKKINQLRNANFKKKLEHFEKNNREILLSEKMKKDKRFLNHFLNNVDEGRMFLGLERKTNKENFDVFVKIKKKGNNNEQKGCLSNIKDIINKKELNNFYVFLVEININGENNVLEIRPNDNYEELCLNFCKKHNLGTESYNNILESIKKKLDEIDGYSFELNK